MSKVIMRAPPGHELRVCAYTGCDHRNYTPDANAYCSMECKWWDQVEGTPVPADTPVRFEKVVSLQTYRRP